MDDASRPVSAINSILAVVMTARTFDTSDSENAGAPCFNSSAQSSANASLSDANLDAWDLSTRCQGVSFHWEAEQSKDWNGRWARSQTVIKHFDQRLA